MMWLVGVALLAAFCAGYWIGRRRLFAWLMTSAGVEYFYRTWSDKFTRDTETIGEQTQVWKSINRALQRNLYLKENRSCSGKSRP